MIRLCVPTCEDNKILNYLIRSDVTKVFNYLYLILIARLRYKNGYIFKCTFVRIYLWHSLYIQFYLSMGWKVSFNSRIILHIVSHHNRYVRLGVELIDLYRYTKVNEIWRHSTRNYTHL